MAKIRPPAVAGSFYPADAQQLARVVDRLLHRANETHGAPGRGATVPKALIVPHAGFRFSGAIAAAAYARVKPASANVRRVVLIGPSHRVPVDGLALPSVTAFDSPLGRIPLDAELIERLRGVPGCVVADEPHATEHSLEVQLPFLQRLLPDFQLTPLAVGRDDGSLVAAVLREVWGGPETLVLISSDLSHFHPYERAQRFDERSSRAIMALDPSGLRARSACGWRGVSGMLRFAAETGLVPTTLDLLNSGDTTGRRERVVGYGAWAFAESSLHAPAPLAETDAAKVIELAQAAIARAAAGQSRPEVAVGTFPAALQRPGATFVTLTKAGRLRGCLGSLQAFRPLVLDVVERAHASARRDPRFPPVRPEELASLTLEVAVLTPPVPLAFRDEDELLATLRPGQDGLTIEDRGRRATFLPKVWTDIPEPERFLARLKQKAGLPPDHWSPTLRAWTYRTNRLEAAAATRSGP
jgi:hypothetical protein